MTIAVPQTALSYAYGTLRAKILSGELAPGTPLVQANLANELKISMTPVREALRDLAAEGLVTLSPHRGAVVTMLDISDAIEIHEIRLKLEPDAITSAAEHSTGEVIERAEQLYAHMSESTGAEWVTANRDFHIVLLSTNPSARLRSMLSSLLEAAALYVGVSSPHRPGDGPQIEHRALLDAYRRGDGAAAAEILRQHISASIKSLEDVVSSIDEGPILGGSDVR